MKSAKIIFEIPEPSDPQTEALWAECIGPDQYELQNCPFFVYGISWKDVVSAAPSTAAGVRTFQKVVRKSGNRTVRVLLPPAADGTAASPADHFDTIIAMGCSWEGANKTLFAINIPAAVSLDDVCDELTSRSLTWEYVDPTFAELFPDEG